MLAVNDTEQLASDRAELLREVVAWTRPQLTHPTEALLTGGTAARADIEAIRTTLAYELYTSGVDADYEPNARGGELEAIIDWLGARMESAV